MAALLLSRLCQRNINPPLLLLHKSLGLLSSSSSSPHLVQARSSAANIGRLSSFRRPELPCRWFAAAAVRSTSPASAPQTVEQGKANENTVSAAAAEDSDINAPRERGGGRRRSSLWRNPRAIVPFGGGGGGLLTPMTSGIGNALWQTTESINRLLRNVLMSPAHFFRRWKEDDKAYKLQLEVPGLSKDDLKVTVEDNVLVIAGQKKGELEESRGAWDEKEEEEEDYYHWSSRSYGYYNTSLILPEDAKADEIKAEVKHGVLYVTIPRTGEKIKMDVREVEVQ